METISEFMGKDHKSCDNQFALAEESAHAGNWRETETAFKIFRDHMIHHFHMEEAHLFPALLKAGGPSGPVQVMHMEHAQMNSLLDQMATVIANKNFPGYNGLAETLLILMQQHNLKEEQILYPIAQRLLEADWEGMRSRMLSFQ